MTIQIIGGNFESLVETFDSTHQKALNLLWDHLDSAQRTQMKMHGWFDMLGSDNRWYRIDQSKSGNVTLINQRDGYAIRGWCLVPIWQVPVFDHMLAVKLLLEDDAHGFCNQAPCLTSATQGWVNSYEAYSHSYGPPGGDYHINRVGIYHRQRRSWGWSGVFGAGAALETATYVWTHKPATAICAILYGGLTALFLRKR